MQPEPNPEPISHRDRYSYRDAYRNGNIHINRDTDKHRTPYIHPCQHAHLHPVRST